MSTLKENKERKWKESRDENGNEKLFEVQSPKADISNPQSSLFRQNKVREMTDILND